MPGKKKTGKRAKKGTTVETGTRQVPVCEENQRYAYVTKMLGGRRLVARSTNGEECQCHIPGKFKGKRNWISPGMLVLLNIRNFQDDKSDVIYIYSEYETKHLQKMGELRAFGENNPQNDEEAFVFEDETVTLDDI